MVQSARSFLSKQNERRLAIVDASKLKEPRKFIHRRREKETQCAQQQAAAVGAMPCIARTLCEMSERLNPRVEELRQSVRQFVET